MSKRSRGWCFTCNNYTDDDVARVADCECDYLIVGFEVGKSGTPHMQGYLYKKSTYRFNEVIRQLYTHFHIESQKGTKIEALTYCMKDCDYWEKGERPQQGHRTDLDAIHYDLKSGKKTSNQIAETYFSRWVQYNRSFEKYENIIKSYDTQLIAYDFSDLDYSMRTIYSNYGDVSTEPGHKCLLYTTPYSYYEGDLLSLYYSKKYMCIFIPNKYVPPGIYKNISIVISDGV